MGYEVTLEFMSGQKPPRSIFVRNRIHRWVREVIRTRSNREDDVNNILIGYDKNTQRISFISLDDAALSKGFESNLSFEGQITELLDQNKKMKNEIRGYRMREGLYKSQIEQMSQKLEELGHPFKQKKIRKKKKVEEKTREERPPETTLQELKKDKRPHMSTSDVV